jgi:L-ascorbate metabolism protein UlaG (beta-lactamase superfamily)
MVDVAVSTHAHFDHDNVYGIDASTVLDRMVGTWEFGDLKITGLADMHVCVTKGMWPWDATAREWWYEPCGPDRPRDQDNVIYYIESGTGDEKITFVHWGDNGYDMLPHNKEFFADHPVDVAFIPVDDSGHIVTPDQVPQIASDLHPRVIVPTHYFIKGIINPSYTTLTADRWFVSQKNRKLTESSHMNVSRAWLESLDIPDGEFLALYFEDNVAFDIIETPDTWEEEMAKSRKAIEEFKAASQ